MIGSTRRADGQTASDEASVVNHQSDPTPTPNHPITLSPYHLTSPHDPITLDVVIVGGGVAGSSLAVALTRSGLRVALIEREARFRDRVRGDSLFPWGAAEVARLGLIDALPVSGARPLPVWQSYEDGIPRPPYEWRADVPTGDVVWGVNHPGLQEALFARAAVAGALTLRPARALRPERERDGLFTLPVEHRGTRRMIRARLIVAADGRESGARRWIGARTIRDPVHHVIGGCLVEGVDLAPDAAHDARAPGAMSLLFRHASGRARLYLVCAPSEGVALRGPDAAARFVARCAELFPEGALASASVVGPVAFFPGIDIAPDRIAGAGIVLIGDAAGANDPSFGQGLSIAFRDARELSALLLQDDWQTAIEIFARRRPTWYEPLHAYARWTAPLITDVGPRADAARARARQAAEHDPWRLGYGAIFALGPEGLPVTEEARERYLGVRG